MPAALPRVLWIGGPPAAAKTTVAARLARRHGLRLYSADTRTWLHRDRALAAGNPAAIEWESLTPTQRWQESTSEQMLARSLHAERGPMVVDDLRALPAAPLIIAEGTVLPAAALSSGIASPARAIWLLPTVAFQDAILTARATAPGPAALYRLQRDHIAAEAHTHAAPTLVVDGSLDIDALTAIVEARFQDAIAAAPRATTLPARRALLREINLAIVAQVRGFYARPWASGDPEIVTHAFVCECGNPACMEERSLTVRETALAPVLAPGHAPLAAAHRGRLKST